MALTPATLTNVDTNEKLKCQFNPTEYTVQKSNSWQPRSVVGKNVPDVTFTGGGQRTMTVELFFDANEGNGNVMRDLRKLWKLTMIDESKKNQTTQRSRPPIVLFEWGSHWQFRAVITNMSVKYTLFKQDGTPVRAVANVTLAEARDASNQPAQNPTSHAKPGYKMREVRPKDTLALIAYEEYGDSTRWLVIAEANGIDDPDAVSAGQVLAIPPLT